MDKYEYKLKLEQIKSMAEAKDYKEAAQIADSINWKKVKSVATLCMIGEIYEKTGRLEDSREILLLAYDRSPVGRNIIYRLTLVAIKMKSLEEAQEYYEEFLEIAPHDNMKYVLKYELARAKGISLPDLIPILEEFKEREYTEEWAFELAFLYHKNGNGEKCVEICDELILWFGEGKYVERALELKMLYQPLNKLQEDKYRRFKQKKDDAVEVSPRENLASGEILSETMKIPKIMSDTGRFNTMNLQAELAKSMQQIIEATEQGAVNDTISNIKKMVGEMPGYSMTGKMSWAGGAEETVPEGSVPEEAWSTERMPEEAWSMERMPEEMVTVRSTGRMPEEELTAWSGENGQTSDSWPATGMEGEDTPDATLNLNYKGILAEEYDGQISLRVPDAPRQEMQITGQMTLEDILAEWEKTKEAARIAIAKAEQRKLEEAKVRALKEAESLMESLTDVLREEDAIPDSTEYKEALETAVKRSALSAAEEKVLAFNTKRIPPLPRTRVADMPEPMDSAAKEEADIAVVRRTETSKPEEESLAKRIIRQQRQQMEELEQELRKEHLLREGVTLEKAAVVEEPLTSLTEEQREIFTYFTVIRDMEKQLCQALEGARLRKKDSRSSQAGNLIIAGSRGSGKTVLATHFVKAFQKMTEHTGGKVGKISAAVLNQKDPLKLFGALDGGCLIIERAGDLSRDSVEKLSHLMEQDTRGLLVILEDDKSGIEKVMSRSGGFAKKFTERIMIPIFTSDDLVAFAKTYARENNCEIEEMGVLALYNSISNIQKLDEPTTLAEVKEIMDEAIYRATRGGLKKLFGGKRNTENGLVLIKEKDFDE